jgi:hypothetical protein
MWPSTSVTKASRSGRPLGHAYGRQFVDGAGYSRWAETVGIVVLYPQVRASTGGSECPRECVLQGCALVAPTPAEKHCAA